MAEAQNEYDWELNFGEIAKIFRGGCIIRARFLQKITEAYAQGCEACKTSCSTTYFKDASSTRGQAKWRKVIGLAVQSTASRFRRSALHLAYYDGYRTATVPANLLQAQRDYFGAHTYERVDKPRGQKFHVDWPEPDRPQLKA